MRIWPIARLLRNMEGSLVGTMAYMPKDEAYEKLKEASGEDFGSDLEAWFAWYHRVKPDGRGGYEKLSKKPKFPLKYSRTRRRNASNSEENRKAQEKADDETSSK